MEEVKRLNKATQQSLDALLERLGPAPALNVQVPIPLHYTPPIPTSAGQKKISLKPSPPPDFDGDHFAGKAFLMSCRTYIWLHLEAFDDGFVKIVWAMSYIKSGRASRWMTWEFKTEARNGRFRFLDWLDFEEEFRKDFLPLNAEAAVRATAVGRDAERDVEWNTVLARDPKRIRLLCNTNLITNIPSRGSKEERIRIHLQVRSNIQGNGYKR